MTRWCGRSLPAACTNGSASGATEQIRLTDAAVLLPGFVDTYVHINEPGTDWAGVTTLVDMPLDSNPVTTTVDALHRKREAAQGNCDVGDGPSPEVAVRGGRAFGRPTEDGMAQLRSMWEASA
jgi:dihydroorotase-like cyclic amidohydrolase